MCVSDPEIAEWLDGNVGIAHAYSGTCAIDIDDLAKCTAWLAERSIDLAELLNAPDAVRIESRPGRAKLLYALAKPLPSFKLPPGLELRCASVTGTTVQDVLPPSVHPDTGRPYAWAYGSPAGHWSVLPPLPGHLLNLWQGLIKPAKAKPGEGPKVDSNTFPRLRALLADWSPDCTYDEWIAVGMALHYETGGKPGGLALWNEWSSTGKKYQGIGDLDQHWRSFRVDHDNPRTMGSLRKQGPAGADEFPSLPDNAPPAGAAPASPPAVTDPSAPMLTGVAREEALRALRRLPRSKQGTIEARISNVTAVLGVPEVAGVELALDTFRETIMKSRNRGEWEAFTDTDYTELRIWLETAGNCDPIGHEMIRQAVQTVATRNKFDTAQLWIEALQWDGKPRIERFFPDYLGTLDTAYERHVSLYTWTALAGRVMAPGCQADMVPVMVSKQGLGKSSTVQAMVPSDAEYVELRLDEPDDAIARKTRGVLIAELAELRGLKAADVDRVKAFVTRRHEKWVPKYQEFATNYPRRFLIIGTTNDEEFLPNDTEHRRWLPVHTDVADIARIIKDRDQFWAEALHYWRAHGIAWRGLDILAKPAREAASAMDTWQEQIAAWIDENPAPHYRMVDIMTNAVGLDSRHSTRAHELRVGRVLHSLGYSRKSVRDTTGRVIKAWAFDPTS
jgi:hypothetical protein